MFVEGIPLVTVYTIYGRDSLSSWEKYPLKGASAKAKDERPSLPYSTFLP